MKRILVVDDQPTMRRLILELLRSCGFESDSVESAEAAMSRLQGETYDLVISDIQMPGRDGFELLTDIRSSQPGLPVILATGDHNAEWKKLARSQGAGYLAKPFTALDLLSEVEAALNRVDRSLGNVSA